MREGPPAPAFRSLPRWGWRLTMLVPCLFILTGSMMLLDSARFAIRAERTTATVVSVERTDDGAGRAYRPTLGYADGSGQPRRGVTHITAAHYDYDPGETVEILYDPAAPGEVRIADFFALWGLPALFICLGGAFLWMLSLLRRKAAARPAPH